MLSKQSHSNTYIRRRSHTIKGLKRHKKTWNRRVSDGTMTNLQEILLVVFFFPTSRLLEAHQAEITLGSLTR